MVDCNGGVDGIEVDWDGVNVGKDNSVLCVY